jgi:serine/threonine protein kinase
VNTRFRVLGALGEGASGVVQRVEDTTRGCTVALKTMRRLSADSLLQLKREFRALADLTHPNLVTLYELVADGDRWGFTMELVEGVDFVSYVRDDPSRLGSAFLQLAEGLQALHQAGRLHRDVKPPNVRVTPAGRVVLLDFGLAAGGTLPYMAPECARGEGDARSDWYSAGVMLYEALTGRLPWVGRTAAELRVEKASPPDPWMVDATLPYLWRVLCMQLLDPHPDDRPSGDEIVRRLATPSSERRMLVGREAQLAELGRALAEVVGGGTAAVAVSGRSGTGKTALVEYFLHEVEADTLVLRGRCYAQESVPYKGLDEVIDDLARSLRAFWWVWKDGLPTDVAALARLFPVLGEVLATAGAAGPDEGPHVQALRRRACSALRELCRRLAGERPLVVFVDDVQWADAESVLLAQEWLAPPDPPPLLLILSCRSEDEEALRRFQAIEALRAVEVPALGLEDSRRLAASLLDSRSPQWVDRVAGESEGLPYFLHELVRFVNERPTVPGQSLGVTLEDVLVRRVADLPAGARDLLEAVSLAGRPEARAVLAEAAGSGTHEPTWVAVLRTRNFIRMLPGEKLACYHDRIGETVAGHMSQGQRRLRHRALARALEASGGAAPDTLMEHFRAAGDEDAAGRCAVRAGEAAFAALAFERAAGLFARAVAWSPPAARSPLRVRLADSLLHCGRNAEAARIYQEEGALASGDQRENLRRLAACEFLASGHAESGEALLAELMREHGLRLPSGVPQVVSTVGLHCLWLLRHGIRYDERAPETVPPPVLDRLDLLNSAFFALARMDPLRAVAVQCRHLELALTAGDTLRVGRALLPEVFIFLITRRPAAAVRDLLDRALDIGQRLGDPDLVGRVMFMEGLVALLGGHWRAAREHSEATSAHVLEHCPGLGWALSAAELVRLLALAFLGELRELARCLPGSLRSARERGERVQVISLLLGVAWLDDLVGGNPRRAGLRLQEGQALCPPRAVLQRLWHLAGAVGLDLYEGDASAGWRKACAARLTLPPVPLWTAMLAGLRGRAAVARAASLPQSAEAGRLLRRAYAEASRMSGTTCGRPLADLLRAGGEVSAGRPERARERLTAALDGFVATDMALHAAVTRLRLGQMVGDGAERARALDWMVAMGVRDPHRLAAVLAPGRFDEG